MRAVAAIVMLAALLPMCIVVSSKNGNQQPMSLHSVVRRPCDSMQARVKGMSVDHIYEKAGRLNSMDDGDGTKTIEGAALMIAAVCSGAALLNADFLSSMGVLLREGGDIPLALRVYAPHALLQCIFVTSCECAHFAQCCR